MTNLEKFISDKAQSIVDMFFEAGAQVKKSHYDKVKSSLHALLAEIEKGVKELKGLPDFEDYAVARKDVLALLHPSEPKGGGCLTNCDLKHQANLKKRVQCTTKCCEHCK